MSNLRSSEISAPERLVDAYVENHGSLFMCVRSQTPRVIGSQRMLPKRRSTSSAHLSLKTATSKP